MERGGTRQSRAPRRKRKFQPPSPWQEAHAIDREMVLARVTMTLDPAASFHQHRTYTRAFLVEADELHVYHTYLLIEIRNKLSSSLTDRKH